MIGDAFASDLCGAAPVPDGMAQLNAVAVGDAHQGRLSQEASRPVLLRMQAEEEAGAFRQLGEQAAVVVLEPGIESARAAVFGDVRMPMVTTSPAERMACERRGTSVMASSTLPKSSVVKSVMFTVSGSSRGMCLEHRMPDAGCRGHFQPAF